MNKERMEQLAASITDEPRKLDMGEWGYIFNLSQLKKSDPPCGTVGCLAGNAVALFDPATITQAREILVQGQEINFQGGMSLLSFVSISKRATKLLDLSLTQAEALFYTTGWPMEFQTAYNDAWNNKQRQADAAAARLRYMIKTGK